MQFRSAWVTGPETIEIIVSKLESPGSGEVTVRVASCGICGTDMHFYRDWPSDSPIPLGHEVSGTVCAVGAGVANVAEGMSVVVQNNVACGACRACLNRNSAACSNIRTYMDDRAAMAEFLTVPADMVIPYEGLDYPEAALAEPVTVALDVCREADIHSTDDILVMGPGIIGLTCAAVCRLRGARKIAVAGHHLSTVRGACRKDAALRMGADAVFDVSFDGWKDRIRAFAPAGFSKVLVTSPPRTLMLGIELAGFAGRIVFNGIDYNDDTVSFSANAFHFAKKQLIASHAIPNWGFPLALDLLRRNIVPPALLLTHRIPFDDLKRGFLVYDDVSEPVIKPVVVL